MARTSFSAMAKTSGKNEVRMFRPDIAKVLISTWPMVRSWAGFCTSISNHCSPTNSLSDSGIGGW